MSEAGPNAHHTRREIARMGVVLTSAAITTLVATSGGLARNNEGEDRNSQGEDRHSHGENRNSHWQNGGGSMRGAPAPATGSGLSTLMVVAGLLLGAKLFRRRGQAADSQ
jgi:hypothetical protein